VRFAHEQLSTQQGEHDMAASSMGAITRYAHPFFRDTPTTQRVRHKLSAQNMASWISQKLGPIPKPKGASVMELNQIIGDQGVAEITQAKQIVFHAVGDTGRPNGNGPQEQVAQAMENDYNINKPHNNPAFFLHLGDVIYGQRKDNLYRDEFYRPYMKYPGKILAVPGNHDGETFPTTDPKPLEAFLANFCGSSATVPKVAADVRIMRQTVAQPGVYWLLNAPFVQVIGLYSNIAEGPGHLEGANGDQSQVNWLKTTLKTVLAGQKNNQRALIIAVHHPAFSNGGHSGSPDMLKQIEDACGSVGVWPTAVLSGHAHNYQRYVRTVSAGGKSKQIPYIVAGCGGHNDSSVGAATGSKGNPAFVKSRKGFGYLLVTANAKQLTIELYTVPKSGKPFDSVTVPI
jgi:hypothetical protein